MSPSPPRSQLHHPAAGRPRGAARLCGLALALALGAGLVAVTTPAGAAGGRVVINEILYHPPDDRDDLEFVELFNAGTNAVDLTGWRLTNAVQFAFSRHTTLPAGGSLVVCRNVESFRGQFGTQYPIAGTFTGSLSHKGKRLALTDGAGQVVEALEYSDRAPWPLAADGYGASLERICPQAPADDPLNWAASEADPQMRRVGTPGARNSVYSEHPLPRVEAHFGPVKPAEPIPVSAKITDAAGIQAVTLVWGVWKGEHEITYTEAPLERRSGDAQVGDYAGSIPAQPEGTVIRFTIRARSASGAERVTPSKTDLESTFCCSTLVNTNTARVPFVTLLTPQPVRPGSIRAARPPRRARALLLMGEGEPVEPISSWNSTAIVFPPGSQEVLLFDHVHVRPRRGGLKVHFLKDRPYHDMAAVDLLFKGPPRQVMSETLAQDFYRRLGVMAPATEHVRLWLGEQLVGYYLLVEQPNKAFLRRNGRDPDGNLYKITWYGNGLIGQHEKQTHPRSSYDDLVQLVEGLNRTAGAAQWDFIQEHFNVDAMIDNYVVNMCTQDWDGFWNNYSAYHDLRPGGKWEVIPWDKDKTWGDFDGVSPNYDWYTMPLTFGMKGNKPVKNSMFDFGPFGGVAWWRPPGYFSGPLLANPEFRRRFLARLREVCETIFTPEAMGPAIDALATRLEEEVRVRAQLFNQDPAAALQEFHNHIQSFHNQVANRRKFLLQQLDAETKSK